MEYTNPKYEDEKYNTFRGRVMNKMVISRPIINPLKRKKAMNWKKLTFQENMVNNVKKINQLTNSENKTIRDEKY